jgi:uncharacterized protein (DUF433 family)
LTFKGTRILVEHVLYYVAKGKDWDRICLAYDGNIGPEAIAEAINLRRELLASELEGGTRPRLVRMWSGAASPPPALAG